MNWKKPRREHLRLGSRIFKRVAVLAVCALASGAALGAALGHWRDNDRVTVKTARAAPAVRPPAATALIPPPLVASAKLPSPSPIVHAALPASVAEFKLEEAKLPPPSPIVLAALPAAVPEFKLEEKPRAEPVPAWRRHAVSVSVPPGMPVIAIVIDDMGLDLRRSQRAASLPGPLTLAYLPYARDLSSQTAAAQANGHELLLHLPMEPQGLEDPGPNALKIGMVEPEIVARVAADLDRVPYAVGLNNHMGSRFTRNASAMRPVMAELKRRGLLFLDSRTASDSVGTVVARVNKVPYAERDVFLDNDANAPAVRARLSETEAIARRVGAAVAIGHPHEGTLDALEDWLATVERRGFALVPISTIVARREARDVATAGVSARP